MPLEGYRRFGGEHADTAAMCNILAFHGVTAPHTGEPYSEPMLLGLGGGVGGGYFMFQYGPSSTFWIGTRAIWYKVSGEFHERIATRVGGKVEIKESQSRPAAARNLRAGLDAGRPVVTWVNQAALPYLTSSPAYEAYFYYDVVVCGADEAGTIFEVDDVASRPWTISAEALALTRASIPSQKNRTLLVVPPKRQPDLKKAIRAGIADCIADMLKPRIKNFGLPAIEKWADLVANPRDKKGWPTVFPPGPGLCRTLYHTFHLIETSGTGGGAFRGMYADFLAESADVLGSAALRRVSTQYRTLASQWSELAEMALPDEAPLFKKIKASARERLDLIRRKGPAAESRIITLGDELQRFPGACASAVKGGKGFPLDNDQTTTLLQRLHDQLRRIADGERQALDALSSAI